MTKGFRQLTAREVFARNLRVARRLKDLSQEALGLVAGLSRAYVSSVERGGHNISIDNMAQLALALKLPLRDLVDPDRFNFAGGAEPDLATAPPARVGDDLATGRVQDVSVRKIPKMMSQIE